MLRAAQRQSCTETIQMILGKLFNTAVLASLWNLANTCSSLKKI